MIRIYLHVFAFFIFGSSIRAVEFKWTELPESTLGLFVSSMERTKMYNSVIPKDFVPLPWDTPNQEFTPCRHKLQDLYERVPKDLSKVGDTDVYILIHDFLIEITEDKKQYKVKQIVNHGLRPGFYNLLKQKRRLEFCSLN
jgi:hypothetical protein